MSIALAIHELATNAVKYGALSCQEGTVDVRWKLSGEDFEFAWTENGGPLVVLGERKGFGSRLILRVLPAQLRGTAEIVYRPEGVVFVLKSTLDAIVDRPATEDV